MLQICRRHISQIFTCSKFILTSKLLRRATLACEQFVWPITVMAAAAD